ncbi:MAG TPA: DUF1761 domain-containing protein [Anaerolineales bacterium]|nr:DUF1761 domain-containing protein [Anaerolineales bacterium]
MDFGSVNWLAVLACVIVSFAVGFVYFSPPVFFNTWWKALGKTGGPGGSNMGLTWTMTTLSSVILAVGMAFTVPAIASGMTGGLNAVNGALTGFMLWLPFQAATSLSNRMFAGHGLKVWAIEAGNHLIVMVLMGLILGAWH